MSLKTLSLGDWTVFLEDWCCHFALDASMLGLVGRLAEDHRVILFSNNPIYRWQNVGEYRMLYNALFNYKDLRLGTKVPPTAPEQSASTKSSESQ